MTEEIMKTSSEEVVSCECGDGTCEHNDVKAVNIWTKHHDVEELAFALLLALTPLTVITFFGQVGLL